jgi:hypothetical protein
MVEEIETYLTRLARELRKRGFVESRILEEARGHLVDALERGLQHGLSADVAQREALARFGEPEAVAAAFTDERAGMSTRTLLIVATVVGLTIAYIDSRPTWDDAGVTAFSMLVCAGVLGLIAPQRPWLWALAVGIWIPLYAVTRAWSLSSLGMVVVLVFPFAGAYLGMGIRRVLAMV